MDLKDLYAEVGEEKGVYRVSDRQKRRSNRVSHRRWFEKTLAWKTLKTVLLGSEKSAASSLLRLFPGHAGVHLESVLSFYGCLRKLEKKVSWRRRKLLSRS